MIMPPRDKVTGCVVSIDHATMQQHIKVRQQAGSITLTKCHHVTTQRVWRFLYSAYEFLFPFVQSYSRDSTVSRTTGFWPGIKHFSQYTSDPDPALTIFVNTYTVHLSYIFSKHSPVCFSQVQDQIPIVMKFFGTERDYENKFLRFD